MADEPMVDWELAELIAGLNRAWEDAGVHPVPGKSREFTYAKYVYQQVVVPPLDPAVATVLITAAIRIVRADLAAETPYASSLGEAAPTPLSGSEEDRLRARVSELSEMLSVLSFENRDDTRAKLDTAKAVCGAFRGMVDSFEVRLDEALRMVGSDRGPER